MLAAGLVHLQALDQKEQRCGLEYVARVASVIRFAQQLQALRLLHTTERSHRFGETISNITWVGSAFEAPALRFFGAGPAASSARGREAWLAACAERVKSVKATVAYANETMAGALKSIGQLNYKVAKPHQLKSSTAEISMRSYYPLELDFLTHHPDFRSSPADDLFYFERDGFFTDFVAFHMSKLGHHNLTSLHEYVTSELPNTRRPVIHAKRKRDWSQPGGKPAPEPMRFMKRRLWSPGDVIFYVGAVAYLVINRRHLLPL